MDEATEQSGLSAGKEPEELLEALSRRGSSTSGKAAHKSIYQQDHLIHNRIHHAPLPGAQEHHKKTLWQHCQMMQPQGVADARGGKYTRFSMISYNPFVLTSLYLNRFLQKIPKKMCLEKIR